MHLSILTICVLLGWPDGMEMRKKDVILCYIGQKCIGNEFEMIVFCNWHLNLKRTGQRQNCLRIKQNINSLEAGHGDLWIQRRVENLSKNI
jgi:hypothetical protein